MAGGSRIVISDQGITISTHGKILYQAGQHLFERGVKLNTELPSLPDLKNPYVLQYLVKNKENQAVSNKPYILIDEDGNIQRGVTSDKGYMELKTTPSSQTVVTRVMMNEVEEANEEVNKEE